MPIRTGADYLEGLRDGREVYLDGAPVADVTKGAFGRVAHTFARIFDMQQDDRYAARLTFDGPRGPTDGAYFWPRDREGLEWRRRLTETVARHTGGVFGRAPEYVPLFLLGMLDIKKEFSQGDPAFERHIEDYVSWAADSGRVLSHAFVDVQADADVPVDQTVVPRLIEEGTDGIVVRGVKSIATFVPHADECLIGLLPRAGLQDHHILYFAIPVNTQGLRIVAREPFAVGKPADHPGAALGDENDTMMIFDDVHVPWDRVFTPVKTPSFAGRVFPRITEWAHWDILVRVAVKAEVLLGLIAALPQMIGRSEQPQAQEALGEMIRYLTTIRSFLYAAEDRGQTTPAGHYMPDPVIVTAGRAYAVEMYRRTTGYIQDIASQGLINAPTEAALESDTIGPVLSEMFATRTVNAQQRTRITRLAWDLVCDSFGGRQTLFELFNAAPWTAHRSQLVARFDAAPYQALAEATAGVGSLEEAVAAVETATAAAGVADYSRVGQTYAIRRQQVAPAKAKT